MSALQKSPSHERLLRAATEVFGARGYHAARVSDIVAQAGVAQGTFYLHFKSKEAIFLCLIDDFFGRLLGETLGRFPASAVADTGELAVQLREMWCAILKHCRSEAVLTSLVLREARAVAPKTRVHVEEWFSQMVGDINGYLRALSALGLVRKGLTDASAWAIFGLIERAIHYAVVVNREIEVEALADEMLQLELTGLLGDRTDVATP
jgi:AcrR family transcriptional regulator|tara:strand:+ start:399 stop:1022 length:624 start_codon:yes stop_codon:yes gene_type:complete